MPPPNKRIIICCDDTFDDFGDTIERKKPGSHTSRALRWLLPPAIFHVFWGLRVFACIKSVERYLLGTEKSPKPFHSNVSRIASAIKPQAEDGTPQIGVCWWHRSGTPQSRFEEAVTDNASRSADPTLRTPTRRSRSRRSSSAWTRRRVLTRNCTTVQFL